MFQNVSPFAHTRRISCGKHFSILGNKCLISQKMLRVCGNWKTFWEAFRNVPATMFQSLFARAFTKYPISMDKLEMFRTKTRASRLTSQFLIEEKVFCSLVVSARCTITDDTQYYKQFQILINKVQHMSYKSYFAG